LPAFAGQVLLLDQPGELGGYAARTARCRLHPENLAYVIYTSGSTGRPKGAGNRHLALSTGWHGCSRRMRWTTPTRCCRKPRSASTCRCGVLLAADDRCTAGAGGAGEHREPERLIDTIERHQVTTLHFVPSMLQVFVREPGCSAATACGR
jgi:non-ribosomal peptide synthetase component F